VKLGWQPKITLEELVKEMMQADVISAKRDDLIKKHGYAVFNHNE
ncbi:MAG: GDP-mannose 4,6-dehydratase, partial [Alphaproteobacteria bacterium]|nr:GDP-mannose 4,6-dehydratase [Alphaproteobacteria bacterium]